MIKKKCQKSFGKDSRWDREAKDGQCAEAWSECNTGFYASCCSQVAGPKDMKAYCDEKASTSSDPAAAANASQDTACQVLDKMTDVKNAIKCIKDAVALLGMRVEQPTPFYFAPGPAPVPATAPAPALAPVVVKGAPPPGLLPTAAPVAVVPAPAPAPAPAPVVFPRLPNPIESRCAMLTALTRQTAQKLKDIKSWSIQDGLASNDDNTPDAKESSKAVKGAHMDPESSEAKDPDLAFSVKGVVSMGDKLDALLSRSDFCTMGAEEDDDDEDDDTAEEDLKKDPAEDWNGDEDEEDSEQVMQVNETAILELLSWDTEADIAVDKFEKNVHPHGYKWWRYRYEYTVVESIVLAFSVMLMYFTMWLLHGVSFFQVNKFYKTGVADKLYRYSWGYIVFHAASLMIMVTVAYFLYIPWGQTNIFNMFASAVKDYVAGSINVPFLGYSWLYMVLDVQFQLFICFALYSLFLLMVTASYQRALEDWKALGEGNKDRAVLPQNEHEYRLLERIMKKRIRNTPEFRQMFHDLKLGLPGVEGLEAYSQGLNDFKLHLYLTDGLGKSLEHLVEVSLTTNMFLAVSALLVACLASHYQVAFMFFLPGFVVLGIAIFIASYFVCRHFRMLSDKDDHHTPAEYVTVRSFCRAIQIMLYCLFFSFSRLLLSADIFEFYPKVYIASLLGLVICLLLLVVVAGQTLKETSCALILPPHISKEQFRRKLEQVLFWHTTEKCHECGVQQFPAHACISREWAGCKVCERVPLPESTRSPMSWRG